MGWTCTYKQPGGSLTQFFMEHGVLRWSGESPNQYRVLDSAVVKFVHYAAIERIEKATSNRVVFATVILTKSFKADRYGHNFCWKDMDESMGPCEDNCPERILNLLTETDSEYAREWRQRCRAKAEARKAMPKLVAGLKLVFADPVRFTTGPVGELVVRSIKGQRILCSRPDDEYGRYRLTRSWLHNRVFNHSVQFQTA